LSGLVAEGGRGYRQTLMRLLTGRYWGNGRAL
jgi:hypothetical protein